jgi:hypothetical protein
MWNERVLKPHRLDAPSKHRQIVSQCLANRQFELILPIKGRVDADNRAGQFQLTVVRALYTGTEVLPLGDHLIAAPIDSLWHTG